MKITETQLKQIIQEELSNLNESPYRQGKSPAYDANWRRTFGEPDPAEKKAEKAVEPSSTPGFENELVNTLNMINDAIGDIKDGMHGLVEPGDDAPHGDMLANDLELQMERLSNLSLNLQKHFRDFGAIGKLERQS